MTSRSVVDVVRALTVRQPWAWAIAKGWKDIENRTWPAPRDLLGGWIAIHSSVEWDKDGFDRFCDVMHQTGRGEQIYSVDDVRSAIIAVARLDREVLSNASPWFSGPHGFVFCDVIELPNPLECRGWGGFWRLAFDTDDALREQLKGMTPCHS